MKLSLLTNAVICSLLLFGTTSSLAQSPDTGTSIPLPIRLLSFTGNLFNDRALLEWAVNEAASTQVYNVERSDNGSDFQRIGTVIPTRPNGRVNYILPDPEEVKGVAYYRLEMIENTGYTSYSPVIAVKNSKSYSFPSVRPNPFTEALTVNIQLATDSRVDMQVLDVAGRTCLTRSFIIKAGNQDIALSDLNVLTAGIYMLEVRQDNHLVLLQRVVKH